jgi:hypothetical protein
MSQLQADEKRKMANQHLKAATYHPAGMVVLLIQPFMKKIGPDRI